MNLYKFREQVRTMGELMGYSLNYDEKFRIEKIISEISKISKEDSTNHEEVTFLAKLKGKEFDYYVLVGRTYTGSLEMPQEVFYYASSKDFVVSKIPANYSAAEYKRIAKSEEVDEQFIGEPKTKLNQKGEVIVEDADAPKDEDTAKPLEDEDDEVAKEKREFEEPLLEEERLAVVIKAIVHDCCVVPKGRYNLTPSHELRYNNAWIFEPSAADAEDLNEGGIGLQDWLHFRYVDSKKKRDLLNLGQSIYREDFFDSLEHDLPLGQWSVMRNFNNTIIYVKNLLWPGFVAYAKIGTNESGYFY